MICFGQIFKALDSDNKTSSLLSLDFFKFIFMEE